MRIGATHGQLLVERLPPDPDFGHGLVAAWFQRFISSRGGDLEGVQNGDVLIRTENGDFDLGVTGPACARGFRGWKRRIKSRDGPLLLEPVEVDLQGLIDVLHARGEGERAGRQVERLAGDHSVGVVEFGDAAVVKCRPDRVDRGRVIGAHAAEGKNIIRRDVLLGAIVPKNAGLA